MTFMCKRATSATFDIQLGQNIQIVLAILSRLCYYIIIGNFFLGGRDHHVKY